MQELNRDTMRAMIEKFISHSRKLLAVDWIKETYKHGSVGLKRNDDAWEMHFLPYRAPKKGVYITWVDLPDDLMRKNEEDFWVSLGIVMAGAFTYSIAAINANLNRDPSVRKASSQKATEARKKS